MTQPIEDQDSNFMERFFRWFRYRPFITSLIVMIMLVTPGFIRIEQNTSTANKAAASAKIVSDKIIAAEARDVEKRTAENLRSCQTRNTFQQNTRAKFDNFFNGLILILTADPSNNVERVTEFVNQLRGSVDTKPEDEDRDCNSDGIFDENDYLS